MKCTILHETRGRMRVHTMQGAMSLQQADILEAYLNRTPGVTKATVYGRTGDAVICYDCPRTAVVKALRRAAGNGYKGALVLCLCKRAGACAGAQQPCHESRVRGQAGRIAMLARH